MKSTVKSDEYPTNWRTANAIVEEILRTGDVNFIWKFVKRVEFLEQKNGRTDWDVRGWWSCLRKDIKDLPETDVAMKIAECCEFIQVERYPEPKLVDVSDRYEGLDPPIDSVVVPIWRNTTVKNKVETVEELQDIVLKFLSDHNFELYWKSKFQSTATNSGFVDDLY